MSDDFREEWGRRVQQTIDARNAVRDFQAGRINREQLIEAIVTDETERCTLAMKWLQEFGATVPEVEDGLGSSWDGCVHPQCDIHVVRPGIAQCSGFCNDL